VPLKVKLTNEGSADSERSNGVGATRDGEDLAGLVLSDVVSERLNHCPVPLLSAAAAGHEELACKALDAAVAARLNQVGLRPVQGASAASMCR
jgi:hypothetical protein